MKRLFLLIIFMLGFVLADSPIPGNAYIISALGIKNTSDSVSYVSGDTSVGRNANYVLAPQVIVYQDSLEYVGSYTPFTGCLNSQHYTNGAPDGMCITGIVNDLTTGGSDKALSAEQGKILDTKIETLNSKLDSHTHNLASSTEPGFMDTWEKDLIGNLSTMRIYQGYSNKDDFITFENVSVDSRCPALFIGARNGSWIEYDFLNLWGYNFNWSKEEIEFGVSVNFPVTVTDNGDGTCNVTLSGLSSWTNGILVVFYI